MYQTSIVNKYGDTVNVKQDVKTIFEIMGRQGSDLLIDALAEYTATNANKFNLTNSERSSLAASLVDSLGQSLNERL